jgi:hypothetical protein
MNRSRLADASFYAVTALALLAPFETLRPWMATNTQNVTNVECAIALALTAWLAGVWRAGERIRLSMPMTLPWAVLLAALLVSALAAPAHTGNALRAAGRLLAALAIVVMVANVVTSRSRMLVLIGAITSSGAVVALVAFLEQREVPIVLEWLRAFRPGIHLVGGQLRSTATFPHPTMASMYLELVFALGVGLLLAAVDDRRRVAGISVFVALVAIGQGIVLTYTRAGWVVIGVTLVLVAFARYRRRGPDAGFRAVMAVPFAVAAVALMSQPAEFLRLRLLTTSQDAWYRAEYRVPNRLDLSTGAVADVEVTVMNTGLVTWRSDGPLPFKLSYHWLDMNDRVVLFNGLRTPFPASVGPGESVTLRAQVQAPPRPGEYRLAWDILNENRFWLRSRDTPRADTRVMVSGPDRAATGDLDDTRPMPVVAQTVGRSDLWRAGMALFARHPLLGMGLDNFRLSYGPVLGWPRFDTRLNTHNMYLEFLVGGGTVGGLAFLWTILSVAAATRSAVRGPGQAPQWVLGGAAAALISFALHGLVDCFILFTPIYVVIALTIGVIMSQVSSREVEPSVRPA